MQRTGQTSHKETGHESHKEIEPKRMEKDDISSLLCVDKKTRFCEKEFKLWGAF
jgi:hypothetical protein